MVAALHGEPEAAGREVAAAGREVAVAGREVAVADREVAVAEAMSDGCVKRSATSITCIASATVAGKLQARLAGKTATTLMPSALIGAHAAEVEVARATFYLLDWKPAL